MRTLKKVRYYLELIKGIETARSSINANIFTKDLIKNEHIQFVQEKILMTVLTEEEFDFVYNIAIRDEEETSKIADITIKIASAIEEVESAMTEALEQYPSDNLITL